MAFSPLELLAIWILTGMGIGLLATALGACRSQWHMWLGMREVLDWLFFVGVAIFYLLMLFWSDWGVLKIWSIAGVLLGYGLWAWLAAPLVFGVLSFAIHVQVRAVNYVMRPVRQLARPIRSQLRRRWLNRKNPPSKE